jgi:alkylhydroperoxidase family enzyme
MFLKEIQKAARERSSRGEPGQGAGPPDGEAPGHQEERKPEISDLFAFQPARTGHLARFTQEVMRGPSELSPGQRELIAAFTSDRNGCPF